MSMSLPIILMNERIYNCIMPASERMPESELEGNAIVPFVSVKNGYLALLRF